VAGEPEWQALQAETREQLADRLKVAASMALNSVVAGLQDPKARLSDRARALEILLQQHALITGQPTERTESLSWHATLTDQDVQVVRAYIDRIDPKELPDGMG
jgi:hypothetical protein